MQSLTCRKHELDFFADGFNSKEPRNIVKKHYEEFGEIYDESYSMLEEYFQFKKTELSDAEKLFNERLDSIEMFDNELKNKYLCNYRYTLIHSFHFDNNMDPG